jgi:hypothetical protein
MQSRTVAGAHHLDLWIDSDAGLIVSIILTASGKRYKSTVS